MLRQSVPLFLVTSIIVLAGCSNTTPKTQQALSAQSATSPGSPVRPPVSSTTSTTSSNPATKLTAPVASTIYFDFDSAAIKDQFAVAIRAQSEYLQKSSGHVELQGHADERGSREYNMALGQKRADTAKRALSALGVKVERIETISYGEDKPKANGHDDTSWAENRRVDFVHK